MRRTGAGSWFSHKLDTLWLQTECSREALYDIATHELSHFLLHHSTPYGELLDELAFVQLNRAIQIPDKYTDSIYCPVYDFATRFLVNPDSLHNKCSFSELAAITDECVRPWSRAVHLERLFEGDTLRSVREAKIGSINELVSDFEQRAAELLQCPAAHRNEIKGKPSYEQMPACPIFRYGTEADDVPIGGANIAEGLAQMLEHPARMEEMREHPAMDKYLGLYFSVSMTFGLDRFNSVDMGTRLRNTYLALCDLACFVPVGAVYGQLRPAWATWFDIHPGHRFIRALNCVARYDLWIDDLASSMKALHNELCSKLGWVAPDDYLLLGSSLHDVRFARHRAACTCRQSHYDAFLQYDGGMPLMKTYFKDHHPSIMYLCTSGNTTVTNQGSPLINYFVQQLTWAYMLSDTIDKRRLLPQFVDYSGLWSNVQDEQEMLSYLYEAMPEMSPERFFPLSMVVNE